MQGDTVLVRAYRGRALILRVWEANAETVYVCSEENYRKMSEGIAAEWPIGFARKDVFVYQHSATLKSVHGTIQDDAFWKNLTPYRA